MVYKINVQGMPER